LNFGQASKKHQPAEAIVPVFSSVEKVQVWSFHCISQVAGHNGEIYVFDPEIADL
jgi:hypothetical protein